MAKICRKNNSQKVEALTPRRSSRRYSFSKRSHDKDKNPYSRRGLDKFSELLAELEEKRQKIYSQMDSDDISFVRFVYGDSDDCVPVIVKIKKENSQEDKNKSDDIKASPRKQDSEIKEKFPIESAVENNKQIKQSHDHKTTKENNFSWKNLIKLNNWRQPYYYFPAVVVLILLFLVFFGRSFTILCTSIGWYVVPILKAENSSNVRNSMNKKDYLRKFSDNKMANGGFSSNHSVPVKDKHDHPRTF